MNLNKKSQLTVFMIIAIVVLVVFGMVYFNKGSITQKTAEAEHEKLQTNKMASSQIEFYVQGCLDITFQNALDLISKQGGYIMQEQPGSMIPFPIRNVNYTYENKSYLIAYRLTRDPKDTLPKYPCKDESQAPKFCSYINTKESEYSPKITYGLAKPVILDANTSYLTIKSQLERYIENQTLECINFTSFTGLNITLGNASADVAISDDGVSTTLFLPMTIIIQDVAPVIQKFKFTSTQRIRLKKIHNAVQEILTFDNKYIDFLLKDHTSSGKFNYNNKEISLRSSELNLEVEQIQNVENFDDLFIFTDHKSKLAGKPFRYMAIRENRMPALNLIQTTSRNPNYDIIISPTQKLEFQPLAFDPDEDKIFYSYDGFTEVAKRIADELEKDMRTQKGDCKNRCASYEIAPEDEGEHIITIKASDGEFTDFQNIRVKVVNSVLAIPNVLNLYTYYDIHSVPPIKPNWQSFEDPVFFDGSKSILPEAGADYRYLWLDSYKDETKADDPATPEDEQLIDTPITADPILIKNNCIVKFGNSITSCEEPNLDIKNLSLSPKQFSEDAVDDKHNITLDVKLVSGEQSQDSVETVNIEVKKCLPFKVTTGSINDWPNFRLPYPYIYLRKRGSSDYPSALIKQLSVPYLNVPFADFKATHTSPYNDGDIKANGCCKTDGTIENTKPCFEFKDEVSKSKGDDIVKILKTQLVVDSSVFPTGLGEVIASSIQNPGQGSLSILTSVKPTLSENTCTNPNLCQINFKQYCGIRGNACSGRIEYIITNPPP